jgi:predicted PurR-regulated permease PerM
VLLAILSASSIAENVTSFQQIDHSQVTSKPNNVNSEKSSTSSPDKPHELSVFFAIGIAINIILVVFFAFWFSREWNRKRNDGNQE